MEEGASCIPHLFLDLLMEEKTFVLALAPTLNIALQQLLTGRLPDQIWIGTYMILGIWGLTEDIEGEESIVCALLFHSVTPVDLEVRLYRTDRVSLCNNSEDENSPEKFSIYFCFSNFCLSRVSQENHWTYPFKWRGGKTRWHASHFTLVIYQEE